MPPSSARNWQADKAATDVFMPTVKAIMGRIMIVDPTAFEDQRENTDLKLLVTRGTRIAVRVRGAEDLARYGHEFTLRSSRPSGTKTELEKIAEGWGDWFFYGFGDTSTGKLLRYLVIDLAAFRRRLVLNRPPVAFADRDNADGSSSFRAYRVDSFDASVIVKQWPCARAA